MSISRDLSNIIVSGGDIEVNGGDVLTTATTFSLANTAATTLNIGGAATAVNIGAATGTLTINNATVSAKTLSVTAGALGTPSITTTGDTNTGIYFPAADTVSIVTGGVSGIYLNSLQQVGFSTSSLGTTNGLIRFSNPATGGANVYRVRLDGEVRSDNTGNSTGFHTEIGTQAATFTTTNLTHFIANQATFGAGSVVTNQIGFSAQSSLIGATNNYGFRGLIPAGTGRWNLYMDGSAENFLGGRLGVGINAPGANASNIINTLNVTGATVAYAFRTSHTISSDVTSEAYSYWSNVTTQAATFTLGSIKHFAVNQNTFGAGSTVTNQYGFLVESNMVGGTNNFGFFGNIPAGVGDWNLFMQGAACNLYNGYSYFNKQIFQYAPAPGTQDTTATLSVAQVQTSMVVSNPATAITLTLPTGTNLETVTAGSNAWQTNTAMELTIINTNATNAITVAGNTGVTIVGSTTVAVSSSATYKIRKTATNTFIAYRI